MKFSHNKMPTHAMNIVAATRIIPLKNRDGGIRQMAHGTVVRSIDAPVPQLWRERHVTAVAWFGLKWHHLGSPCVLCVVWLCVVVCGCVWLCVVVCCLCCVVCVLCVCCVCVVCVVCCVLCIVVVCCLLLFWTRALMCDVYGHNDMAMQ